MIGAFQNFVVSRFGASFQRFVHNFAAHSFGQVVNVVSQIVTVPTFLHYWTKPEYGEWLVMTSIPSLLWTLDNGLSGLAANRMTVASGSGDWVRTNLIFHNVLFIQGVLSFAILAVTALLTLFTNISAAFGFTLMTRAEAGEVLFIMILYMLLGYGLGLLRAAYRASMMEARGVAVANMARLTDFIATIVVLTAHGHPVALACGLLSSMSFWFFASWLDVRSRCTKVTFSFGPLDPQQVRAMFVDGLPVLAGTGANAFFLQGYPLIVNSVLGPVAVVTLTTIRTASRTLLQLVSIVGSASSSEMSRTYGSRDWDGYLRLLKVLLGVTFWSSVGAAVFLSLAGPWVIEKWTSGRVEVSHLIMMLFALSVACQCGWNACGSILFSTNMHHLFNYTYFFLTVVSLAVTMAICHRLGFIGVPSVMLITDGLLLGVALVLCYRKLSFIRFSSLAGIFSPRFYWVKLGGAVQHLRHRSA